MKKEAVIPCVTHIITGLNVGGAERALHTLLTGGLQSNYRNNVISLMDEGHYGPLLRSAGVPVVCLRMSTSRPTLASVLRLRRTLYAYQPDLVQGWMYHGNVAGTIGRILTGSSAPVIWNMRTSLDDIGILPRRSRTVIELSRHLSRLAHRIIYNSLRAREQHERHGFAGSVSLIIPNGFDLSRWIATNAARAEARALLGFNQDTPVLGFVGRDDPKKDPGNFFLALESVLTRNPALNAVVVGRGLKVLAPRLQLHPRVSFLGERSDVPKLLPGFDVHCLSSRVEGFPNVIGEAMACGVPCVTTDVGDAHELVRETGWVVPPGDAHALAGALETAFSCTAAERRARGRAARVRIAADYSLHTVVNTYRDLYQSVLGNV